MISLIALRSSLELGLVYSLMAMGLFVSFKVLDIADLTVDGSFTLGACVCAVLTINGRPYLALFMALICGALAGMFTAFLQTKLFVEPILAGIISMTGLYSINLRIMGSKPNLSLSKLDTPVSACIDYFGKSSGKLIFAFIVAALSLLLLILFLHTKLGLQLRATGDNETMVLSSSINTSMTKTLGLAVANALVAFSGACLCQMQKYSDIQMGIGTVVIGLASIIIGQVLFGKRGITFCVISVVVGSVAYRLLIALVLELGVEQQDLKLISALVVMIAVSYPAIKNYFNIYKNSRGGGKNA